MAVLAGAPLLEQVIGLKWAGWIGAAVLTIGAALGIKFAYDQGWFLLMPPVARLAMMSMAGVLLLAAGEIVYRRVNRVSAASLFGAGVAMFFLVSYAGHGYYDLYSRDAAFILMGLSTLLGAAVAVRGKLVSIAVLALLGGNLAPIVLSSGHARLVPFLSYLLMLQLTAVTLAAWHAQPRWWMLRALSLATTALWIATLLLRGAGSADPYGPLFLFLLVYGALYQAELIISVLRANPGLASVPENDPDPSPAPLHSAGAGFSMTVTALLTAALLVQLTGEPALMRGLVVLALAAVAAASGVLLALRAQSIRSTLGEGLAPGDALSLSLRLQAAGLVVVAVPVALSGVWIVFAWSTFAVLLAALGAALDLPTSRRAAVAVWVLALIQLVLWTALSSGAGGIGPWDPWLSLFGHTIPVCTAVALVHALLGHVIAGLLRVTRRQDTILENAPDLPHDGQLHYARPAAARLRQAGEMPQLARVLNVLAGLAWVAASLTTLPPLGATAVILLYAAALFAAHHALPWLHLATQALLVLCLAAGKWLLYDTFILRFDRGWSALERLPFLNAQFLIGVALLAALIFAARLLRRRDATMPESEPAAPLLGLAAVLVVLWCGSFEIDRAFERLATIGSSVFADPSRAKQVGLSIFWALFAVASVAAGFRFRIAGLRYIGLGLLAVTLVKVMAIDLSDVGTGYRVLSFVALGLLMLGTSVLYGRLSPRLLGRPS